MTSYHEVWLADHKGNRIELLDGWERINYALTLGSVGPCEITLPYDPSRIYSTTAYDRQLHVYRAAHGGAILELMGVYFCRRWQFRTDGNGKTRVTIYGMDANDLLERRIVAYYAGSAQAEVSGAADNLMKEVVRDNLGSDSTTDYAGNSITTRDLSSTVTVTADASAGPSISLAFAWTNVLSALQKIQSASRKAGTEVFFGMVAPTPGSFEFHTRVGRWGRDRTKDGTHALLIGGTDGWGNIENPEIIDDAMDEINFVYAGGQGQGSERNIQEVSDTVAIGQSQYNRREGFAWAAGVRADDTNEDAALTASGNDYLSKWQARTSFRGSLTDSPEAPFAGATGWQLGDTLTVAYLGRQFNVHVKAVAVTVSARDGEKVAAKVESTA